MSAKGQEPTLALLARLRRTTATMFGTAVRPSIGPISWCLRAGWTFASCGRRTLRADTRRGRFVAALRVNISSSNSQNHSSRKRRSKPNKIGACGHDQFPLCWSPSNCAAPSHQCLLPLDDVAPLVGALTPLVCVGLPDPDAGLLPRFVPVALPPPADLPPVLRAAKPPEPLLAPHPLQFVWPVLPCVSLQSKPLTPFFIVGLQVPALLPVEALMV
jgi:hypothetical protein